MLVDWNQIIEALWQTIIMVSFSLLFSAVIGVVLGILLVITRKGHLWENPALFRVMSGVVNVLRSIPFIILLVAVIPFTRLIVGTSIGTAAATVPMVIYAGPYIARLIEKSLLEVDSGVMEDAKSIGATPWHIVLSLIITELFSLFD